MFKNLSRVFRENRNYILSSFLFLLAGSLIGFFFKGQIDEVAKVVLKRLSTIGSEQDLSNPFNFLSVILKNNLMASLYMIVFGLLTFGVWAVYALVSNGAILGYFMGIYAQAGINPWKVFSTSILPHGIFEFTAIILSCAVGMRLGGLILRLLTGLLYAREGLEKTKHAFHYFLKDLPLLVGTIAVLLIVAATVESFLTPYILNSFISEQEKSIMRHILS